MMTKYEHLELRIQGLTLALRRVHTAMQHLQTDCWHAKEDLALLKDRIHQLEHQSAVPCGRDNGDECHSQGREVIPNEEVQAREEG